MKSKNITIIIILLVMALGGGAAVLLLKSDPKPEDTTAVTKENTPYTTEQVAQHASKTDCWTIIDGSVYNITSYVARHPGGAEILRACGTDATTLFKQRETPSGESVGSGSPHSPSAESQLSSLLIGTVKP